MDKKKASIPFIDLVSVKFPSPMVGIVLISLNVVISENIPVLCNNISTRDVLKSIGIAQGCHW